MTDGNTYAINKYLNDQEDWDALQEVTTELEQAEARIEELKRAVRYEADLAQQALDAREELEAKLSKAVKLAEEALYLDGDQDVCAAWCSLWERLEELKGQDDE